MKRGKLLGFISVLFGLLCVSQGEVHEVSTAQELIELFRGVSGSTLNADIILLDDLDFSKTNINSPLGADSNDYCVSYSGTLDGNHHSIKGLVMNNANDGAGLFCSLENAIINNLVIGSSCSFNGSTAGGLSVLGSGSLSLTNVTNKATVSGEEQVGGLLGTTNHKQGEMLMIDNCLNEGQVNGMLYYIGGFVGRIISDHAIIHISNSVNKGTITNGLTVGGFIGQIAQNRFTHVMIVNSTNSGTISKAKSGSGFLGGLLLNEFSKLTISGCLNRGAVSGESSSGFISLATGNTETDITIYNSVNEGAITGENNAEGFANIMDEQYLIMNCINKGTIKSGGASCGIVFNVEVAYLFDDYNYTIVNSANKGLVHGSGMAYGICPCVTRASNVVSMGDVKAYIPYTFWTEHSEADLFYGLKSKCSSCQSETTLFKKKGKMFVVTATGEYVHELLNDEAEKKHYQVNWTSQLDLVGDGLPKNSDGVTHTLSPFVYAFMLFVSLLIF